MRANGELTFIVVQGIKGGKMEVFSSQPPKRADSSF
jgi:hypothetical protein